DPQQNLSVNGGLNVDQADSNNGTAASGLSFGSASGEAVASKRTNGGNQHGLDFYTNSAARLSISKDGNIGIGTTSPATKLDVTDGGVLVRHPLADGNTGRALEIGSQQAANDGAPNGRIGFPGYGIQHGQVRWIPANGGLGRFEFIDSSQQSP